MSIIILLSGYKKSGKDHISELMVNNHGFKRLAFADNLKDLTATQYGIVRQELDDQELKEKALLHMPVLSTDPFSKKIHDHLDGEFAVVDGKKYWTRRALCILEGSVKRSATPNYWVDQVTSQIKFNDNIVIADFRYQSEYKSILEYADRHNIPVVTIRIDRFDTSPSNEASERNLDSFKHDYVLSNRSTVEILNKQLDNLLSDIQMRFNSSLWV